MRISSQFAQESGREPTDLELSERTGLPLRKVRTLPSIPRQPISLEAPLTDEGDTRVGDLIGDQRGTSQLDEVSAKHLGHRLRHLLKTLTPREEEVLKLRFGVDRPDSLTLEEVGRAFAVSRERIRQIEAEALSKLRERAAAEELDSHLAS
jgi:RNA polymerase primary sigma factor